MMHQDCPPTDEPPARPASKLNLLRRRVRELEREAKADYKLMQRLSLILTQTANALKGEPEPGRLHDWSDLPKVARERNERIDELELWLAHEQERYDER